MQNGLAKKPELPLTTYSYLENTVLLIILSVRIFTSALKHYFNYTSSLNGSTQVRKVTCVLEKLQDQKTCFEVMVKM